MPESDVLQTTRAGLLIVMISLTTPFWPAHAESGEISRTTSSTLIEALIAHGWVEETDDAGNRLYYPPSKAADSTSGKPADQAVASSAPSQRDVHRMLRERGWRIETNASGETLLLPAPGPAAQASEPAVASRTEEPAEEPTGQTPTPQANLYDLLRERGWHVDTTADGDTLLSPAQRPADQASKQPESPIDGQAETASAPLVDVKTMLRDRGWHIETTPGGDTLLSPVGRSDAETARQVAQPTEVQNAKSSAPQIDIHQMLRDRGWRIETTPEGDTLLLSAPPGEVAAKPGVSPEWPGADQVDMGSRSADAALTIPYTPAGRPESRGTISLSEFEGALTRQGWDVQTSASGIITLYPPDTHP